MNSTVAPEIKEVMEAVHYRPAISIIMPFDLKMGLKNEVMHSLKIAADKVELELLEKYTGEICALMMNKLRTIIKNLNFNTYKKSIAIYVSPVFEKVLYLDIPVEEKIIIDESFEIRDLVYSKKEIHKYLVLFLSNKESKIFLGDSTTFIKILSNAPENINAYKKDMPERVGNFSDPKEQKEILINKFLHHIDDSLSLILKGYDLPVFVLGTSKIAGYFKKLTRHTNAIVNYVHGNYEEHTFSALKEVLQPYVSDWRKIKQKHLVNQLEGAAGKKKLASGIKEVWKEAANRKGRLLLVEKNYMYAAQNAGNKDEIEEAVEPYNKFSYIKDAVDDVIEKVLQEGGDVEFVDDGVLNQYNHIALIQYY